MRRFVAVVLASVALVGLPATAAAHPAAGPRAVAAKTCSAGYKHAVINGQHKCLRRGQYCARAYKNQYPKYGYQCRADSKGVWRLQ
jgi:hypothetical protein